MTCMPMITQGGVEERRPASTEGRGRASETRRGRHSEKREMLFIGTHSVTLAPCAFTAASALWEII